MAFSTRPKWIDNLDMFDIDGAVLDWIGRADDHMDYLTAERDRLREALKMLMEDVGREFKPWEHVHCEWSWHKANQALQEDRDE